MSEECWKEVPGYEGMYEVSNQGRVRSWKKKGGRGSRGLKPTIKLPSKLRTGYYQIALYHKGIRTRWLVHRLVARAFVLGECLGTEVNHRDECKDNNRADNLEFVTHRKNVEHSRTSKYMTPMNVAYNGDGRKFPYIVRFYYAGKYLRVGSFSSIQKANEVAVRVRQEIERGVCSELIDTYPLNPRRRKHKLPLNVYVDTRSKSPRYRSIITYQGKRVGLGTYSTVEEAAEVSKNARRAVAQGKFVEPNTGKGI